MEQKTSAGLPQQSTAPRRIIKLTSSTPPAGSSSALDKPLGSSREQRSTPSRSTPSRSDGDWRAKKHRPDDDQDELLLPQWDFDSEPNIRLREPREPPKVPPSAELEYRRSKEVADLRRLHADLCRSELGVPAPSESFNRWLFEQLAVPSAVASGGDPLLRSPELGVSSQVLKRELHASLPASLYLSWRQRDDPSKALDALYAYAEAGIEAIDEHLEADTTVGDITKEEMTSNRGGLEDLLEWIEARYRRTKMADVKQRTSDVKSTFGPFFARFYGSGVDAVCSRLVEAAEKAVKRLAGAASDVSADPTLNADVRVDVRRDEVRIAYRDDVVKLSTMHYGKVKELFERNSPDAAERGTTFKQCLYTLARRYRTFFGLGATEGGTFHAAATEAVFRALQRDFGVCQENFASPFNCYFVRFNSAFPDIDAWFGSRGSFFDFEPVEGSFETGPPYTEEVMERMALHLEHLLASSDAPLSFVVFVPDWTNPLASNQAIMSESKFLRHDLVVSGGQYSYVSGSQHHAETKERFFLLPFDTHIYFLQNDAGAAKWPVTKDKVRSFVDGMAAHNDS